MTLTEDNLKQVRAEIIKAFGELVRATDWYTSGYDNTTHDTARVIEDVVKMAVMSMTPAEPEPVNPFAPKRTADQWAVILRSTIDAAEKDGHDVWIGNDCCGCSRMTLEVGSETKHVRVIGDSG